MTRCSACGWQTAGVLPVPCPATAGQHVHEGDSSSALDAGQTQGLRRIERAAS